MGKRGFLSKALDMFTEEVDETNEEVVQEEQPQKEERKATPTQKMSVSEDSDDVADSYRRKPISTTSSNVKVKFNEEFYNHFQLVIEENDLDGADYFEFRNTYEVLKATPGMTEIGALQATFNVLKGTSPELTVDILINTADHYLSVIQKEDDNFHSQLDEQLNTEIGGRNNNITDEIDLQNAKLEQIESLKTEIAESQEREQILRDEVVVEQKKIDEVTNNWDYTINVVKENIETDKGNIQQYLTN